MDASTFRAPEAAFEAFRRETGGQVDTCGEVAAGAGGRSDATCGTRVTVTKLAVTGDFVQTRFNLNGIVAQDGVLVVDQTSTGKLFRIDAATGVADQVDLGGAVVGAGTADGMQLLGHTLYVVRNFENLVTVVRLGAHLASGVVLGDITAASLDVPTAVTVAAGRLWVVNARFTTPSTPQGPLAPG